MGAAALTDRDGRVGGGLILTRIDQVLGSEQAL